MEHASDLPLPSYETDYSSGVDLLAAVEESIVVGPYEYVVIPTGFALEIPAGYEAQIRSRSGLAAKYGIYVLNSPGTIDSDFRGELKVILSNFGENVMEFFRGDRVAQLVFAPVVQVDWNLEKELRESVRGEGGLGSTGYKFKN
jgi:dUTP pyrophosphatase